MTVLSQLLEEAVQHSTELTGRAEAATKEVAEVLEGATALTDFALAEADALHKDIADALEAIGHARGQVDTEAGRASTVLDDLPARADATESAVRELLAGVREDVTHLSELRARLLTRVDESNQQTDTEFQDLARRVQDLQERLEARLTAADDHVKQLRQAVDEARTHLGDDQHRLREAIQSLGVLGTDKAHAFVGSMHAVMVIIGRNVVEFCNDVLKAHNDGLKALRAGFTDESPAAPDPSETWVHEALQPIRDAVAEFALLPPPAEESLGDSATSIVQKADKALTALDAIARSLEHAAPAVSSLGGA